MKVAVVIPIYKTTLNKFEIISLTQCKRILGEFPTIFAASESICLDQIKRIVTPSKVIIFKKEFFKDIISYSTLLLSTLFYKAFVEYDFILIYQLDAFVFKNELEYWCKQDYDYIGAPWFEHHAISHKDGNLWRVGNGGFSLRNVKKSIAVLEKKGIVLSPSAIINEYKQYYGSVGVKLLPRIMLKSIGIHNTTKSYINMFCIYNEDRFWSYYANKIKPSFKLAPVNAGIKFAFECDPSYLYRSNNNKLPFGCHAWRKYDFAFWKPFIEQQGFALE